MIGSMPIHVAMLRSGDGVIRRALLALACALSLAGCTAAEQARLPRSSAELIRERAATEEKAETAIQRIITRNIERIKAEYDEYRAGRSAAPPVVDLLVLSGGGDWGAFGAGVLKGWGRVPSGPMARPTFDAVTGVSTGALIAPFAFIGDEASYDRINQLYRNPKPNWVRPRGLLSFLFGGAAYADIPGLEEDMRQALDTSTMQRIVNGGRDGRILAVNTSNLDFGEMRAWDIVAEAQRALETGDPARLYDILLASAGVPGAFPPREIDGSLYVDGAVTGNILYGGRLPNEDGFVTAWKRVYPDVPVPKIRYWVIFNNQIRTAPEVVQPNWSSILPQSTTISTRTATVNSMRHLFALAEISRLRQGTDVEVRYIAVPDDWVPPRPGIFIKEVMNALADMGERMGADPRNWRSQAP
jgi:predicted acylesterase/phospholipase RssA